MNPIGKIFDDGDLHFLAGLMLRHDLVAIADEVYEHLVFDGRRHNTLFALPEVRDRVVRIGSAGKTFSVTGWKVGYVTADARLLAPIIRAHQFVTFTTPPALQAAVAFGLRLPSQYFDGLRTALEERRDLLADGLRRSDSMSATSARPISRWPAWRRSTQRGRLRILRRLTLEAGVTAVPLSSFYGDRGVRSHIRFCFAKKRETLRRRFRGSRPGASAQEFDRAREG